jgi:hypothetical protein
MAHLVVIVLCLLAGVLLRRAGRISPEGTRALNAYVLYLAVPALVLLHVPEAISRATWGLRAIAPVSVAWVCLTLAWIILHTLGTHLRVARATLGAMVLTAGLGNTAFLGYPLLGWLLGPAHATEAMQTAVLVDQPGSFLVISTYAVVVAAFYAGAKVEPRAFARRMLTFPPLLAMVVAGGLAATQTTLPTLVHDTLEKLALTLVPTSLVGVGAALRLERAVLRQKARAVAAVLALKLLAWPLLMLVVYQTMLGLDGVVARVTILDAGMAPMVTSAVLVAEFELDTDLANLAVALGVPCSLLTVPLWHALLGKL